MGKQVGAGFLKKFTDDLRSKNILVHKKTAATCKNYTALPKSQKMQKSLYKQGNM